MGPLPNLSPSLPPPSFSLFLFHSLTWCFRNTLSFCSIGKSISVLPKVTGNMKSPCAREELQYLRTLSPKSEYPVTAEGPLFSEAAEVRAPHAASYLLGVVPTATVSSAFCVCPPLSSVFKPVAMGVIASVFDSTSPLLSPGWWPHLPTGRQIQPTQV